LSFTFDEFDLDELFNLFELLKLIIPIINQSIYQSINQFTNTVVCVVFLHHSKANARANLILRCFRTK